MNAVAGDQRRHVVVAAGNILEFGQGTVPVIGSAFDDLGEVVNQRDFLVIGYLADNIGKLPRLFQSVRYGEVSWSR